MDFKKADFFFRESKGGFQQQWKATCLSGPLGEIYTVDSRKLRGQWFNIHDQQAKLRISIAAKLHHGGRGSRVPIHRQRFWCPPTWCTLRSFLDLHVLANGPPLALAVWSSDHCLCWPFQSSTHLQRLGSRAHACLVGCFARVQKGCLVFHLAHYWAVFFLATCSTVQLPHRKCLILQTQAQHCMLSTNWIWYVSWRFLCSSCKACSGK